MEEGGTLPWARAFFPERTWDEGDEGLLKFWLHYSEHCGLNVFKCMTLLRCGLQNGISLTYIHYLQSRSFPHIAAQGASLETRHVYSQPACGNPKIVGTVEVGVRCVSSRKIHEGGHFLDCYSCRILFERECKRGSCLLRKFASRMSYFVRRFVLRRGFETLKLSALRWRKIKLFLSSNHSLFEKRLLTIILKAWRKFVSVAQP
jgi:hypothetical protein